VLLIVKLREKQFGWNASGWERFSFHSSLLSIENACAGEVCVCVFARERRLRSSIVNSQIVFPKL
jgi:hypothetical protein